MRWGQWNDHVGEETQYAFDGCAEDLHIIVVYNIRLIGFGQNHYRQTEELSWQADCFVGSKKIIIPPRTSTTKKS